MSKQTVLQQEIERQEIKIKVEQEKRDSGKRWSVLKMMNAEHTIKALAKLLPASEQELKDAYKSGYMAFEGPFPDDWFRNEFGEG